MKGYEKVYQLDTQFCEDRRGWYVVAGEMWKYACKEFKKRNLKTHLAFGRFWQIWKVK